MPLFKRSQPPRQTALAMIGARPGDAILGAGALAARTLATIDGVSYVEARQVGV